MHFHIHPRGKMDHDGRASLLVRMVIPVLVVALALTLLPGCSGSGAAEQDTSKNWVILVDLSATAQSFRDEYRADIAKIVDRLEHGDKIAVMDISAESVRDTRMIVEMDLVAFEPTTDNRLMIKKQRAEFEAEHDISKTREEIMKRVDEALKGPITGSDITGAIRLAARQFEVGGGQARLVVLSDMLYEQGNVDFRNGPIPTKELLSQIETSAGDYPDLRGARVVVGGAFAATTERWNGIRDFWLAYFQECNGEMTPADYGRNIPLKLIESL